MVIALSKNILLSTMIVVVVRRGKVEMLRKMLQETHDSTIRQEGMILDLKNQMNRNEANQLNHSGRLRSLEDKSLVVETKITTLAKVWTIVAALVAFVYSAAELVKALWSGHVK